MDHKSYTRFESYSQDMHMFIFAIFGLQKYAKKKAEDFRQNRIVIYDFAAI